MHDLGQDCGSVGIVCQAQVVAQDRHAQRALGDDVRADCGDASTAAQTAAGENPLGLQLPQCRAQRVTTDIQILRQAGHPGKGFSPASAPQSRAQVLGGEFTGRDATQRFHGLKTYPKFGPVAKIKIIELPADHSTPRSVSAISLTSVCLFSLQPSTATTEILLQHSHSSIHRITDNCHVDEQQTESP
jgi:hypothetical protein